MRKTRLVIQPTRCLHTIGFLLLFMSCPVFGDWGLVQPDSDPTRGISEARDGARVLLKHPPESRIVSEYRMETSRNLVRQDRRENTNRRTEAGEIFRVANRRLVRDDTSRRVAEMRMAAPRQVSDVSRRLLRQNQSRRETNEPRTVRENARTVERREEPTEARRVASRNSQNGRRTEGSRRESIERLDRSVEDSRRMARSTDRLDRRVEDSRRMARSTERLDRRVDDSRRIARSTERLDRRVEDSRRMARSTERLDRRVEDSRRMARSTERQDRRVEDSRRIARSTERLDRRVEEIRRETRSSERMTNQRRDSRCFERRNDMRRDSTTAETNRVMRADDIARGKRDSERQVRSSLSDLRYAFEKDNARKISVIAGESADTRRNDVENRRVSQVRMDKTLKTTNAWETYKDIVSHCVLGAAVYFTARSPKSVY